MPCMFCGEPTVGWVGMCQSCEEREHRKELERLQQAEEEERMLEELSANTKEPYEPPTMTRIESVEVITL